MLRRVRQEEPWLTDRTNCSRSDGCGADVIVTWLDRARRDVLSVHPRDDPANPEQGVFSTRSPHRPNPIGLHRVNIVSIEGTRILVRNLEAVNRTPIVDMKPVLNRQLDG
jgi:tRNA-Thr(GGU) m(6)t(6)A37 methyltransferase TsaA